MKNNTFSQKEADEIRSILLTLHTLPRNEQKQARAILRSKYRFRISDYTSSKAGFKAQDFDYFVTQGAITIR